MSNYDNVRPRRWGVGAPKGATMTTTFCPDCDSEIPAADFVAHREKEHPPALKMVAVEGIVSKTAFGYDPSHVFDPPDPED